MPITRRDFVRLAGQGAFALSALALGCSRRAPSAAPSGAATGAARASRSLHLLVLGGTGFLGPDFVRAARQRGHELTLFNRGKTNPQLFADVEQLHGDRDGGLEPLRGRRWDAVLDTSGYVPRVVRQSAELLASAVERYLFVSSISAYADASRTGITESSAVAPLPASDPATENVREHYGALKAACERTVETALPGRTIVVRPGLIVGPGDPTDRFTYWPVRLDRGGEVLAPGDGEDPVQVIDARDLAAFLVKLLEESRAGTYNATGPRETLTMRRMLEACRPRSSDARLTWIPEAFLEKQGVQPWSDMPVWVPRRGEDAGMGQVDASKAISHGLTFRPVETTAEDTLGWWKSLPEARREKLRAGLAPAREREVLETWRSRR